jgi:GT2 family glycosyltransferase
MSGPTTAVAAVVVSHNSAETLARCLTALLAQPALTELLLVDNGSRDGWRDCLPSDGRLRTLANSDNPGFGAACNQGAAATTSPWLLLVNPDCFLAPDSLERLLGLALTVESLGALGAELVDLQGRVDPASRRRAPTPSAVLAGFRNRSGAAHDLAAGTDPLQAVDAISGALMLMPRAAFEQVGGFDTGYRLHCEDLDLCRRLRNAGFAVAVAAGVRVLHLRGTSSRGRPLWVEWQKHRGMLRYFRKFDAAASPWWVRVAVPIGIALRFPIAAARAWLRTRQPM